MEIISARLVRSPWDAGSLLSLSWGLQGNLANEDLLELPHGGRLLSERILWSRRDPEGGPR